MKSLKKIFIIIIVLLVVFSGVVYIDYFLVKTKNTFPKIAIKEELNDETKGITKRERKKLDTIISKLIILIETIYYK